jgi:hypothetical protein
MPAFLEPPDGRKPRRAIFRLPVRKNFVKAARKHFLENRLELSGIAAATHGNPRIPGTCQRGESSRNHERVRAGLRNARAKAKTLGRPRVVVHAPRTGRLRAQGRSIREIADELGYSPQSCPQTLANRAPRDVAITGD